MMAQGIVQPPGKLGGFKTPTNYSANSKRKSGKVPIFFFLKSTVICGAFQKENVISTTMIGCTSGTS
jgi:hypothetical protein